LLLTFNRSDPMKRDLNPGLVPAERDNDSTRRGLTVLSAADVAAQLQGRERELIDLAAQAYVTHGRGLSCLPQSEYLRFPGKLRERIIPKAGWLGGEKPVAGIKWISSFPDNVSSGLPRASALIVLNDPDNGRPRTVMEGSLISCQRTAAGAALAARVLHAQPDIGSLGLVGCGPIGRETLRFILADERQVRAIQLFDLNASLADETASHLLASGFGGDVRIAESVDALLGSADVSVFATSAVVPSIESIAHVPSHATVLHVSLRDFSAQAVLAADNLTDDIEHVLQARTSVHLVEEQLGHRRFLRGTLADVLERRMPARIGSQPVMFHPFGLAALDLAFAQHVELGCERAGLGAWIPDFLV
jgi:N-[(2S)-2-amino-2-carboxyethyl]-L-glutamate dehydrogenase